MSKALQLTKSSLRSQYIVCFNKQVTDYSDTSAIDFL